MEEKKVYGKVPIMNYYPLCSKLFDFIQGKPGAEWTDEDGEKLLEMGRADGLVPAK